MNLEIENIINEVTHLISNLKEYINVELVKKRIEELNKISQNQELWSDRKYAEKILREKNHLEKSILTISEIESEFKDCTELIEIGKHESDNEIIFDAEQNLRQLLKYCSQKNLEALLSGEADSNDCYLEIHPGAGGTEAQDWALMLSRMYQRWAERKKFKIEILDEIAGEEAGLKSITIRFSGINAYGWSKLESGVHRLVRISPFDSSARRHTSFASVWVYPVVDETIDISINEKDLRIDTYRSSGAGGQHVNTTDSAIRITHLPSKIVVQCQNDRSQHRNKASAMNMLKARLYELELQKREKEAGIALSEKTEIGWGNQIRSYVLHPYQMVKDLRTNVESSRAQSVLDGDIDKFIEASLIKRVGRTRY